MPFVLETCCKAAEEEGASEAWVAGRAPGPGACEGVQEAAGRTAGDSSLVGTSAPQVEGSVFDRSMWPLADAPGADLPAAGAGADLLGAGADPPGAHLSVQPSGR